ncbi:plasmid pRiA4b ORF-3 family protein [Actinacidiphila soli]|uniref:plasmid pRiA4b ORF-3 family protein n=1 Tax=Actinacidiphila soli TaxID=2487275 RepID=UPI000FCA9E22|nr:plasmid pRiA4b ORF-3 family protein [Actinacidiphila soli]
MAPAPTASSRSLVPVPEPASASREPFAVTADPVPTYQLKITLRDTSPPIWRRVTLPADTSLGRLHDIIQTCFGWHDSHLHSFTEPGSGHQFVDFDSPLDRDPSRDVDEDSASVAEVLPYDGGRLQYTYDFGDDWRHQITLEKTLPAAAADRRVHCTGGRRAMPYAEDIGGAWGLQAVLHAVADRTTPAPEPWTDLVETLREEGFDPAGFDRDALDRELAELDPQPPTAAPAPRPTRNAPGRERCACGEDHDDEDLEMELLPVRPVTLAPRADLAAAARKVPLIGAALRLAHWCQDGRAVTSRDVLKPALGRLAVHELELWAQDNELRTLRPTERDKRLARLRSSGDLPCLDNPWRLALYAGLVEISSGIARPGTDLPAAAGDEGVLDLWYDALGAELDELDDFGTLGLPPVLLAALGMQGEDGNGLAAVVLRALYEVPDDEWLDTALLVGALRKGLPTREARLIELLLLQILDQAAIVLAEYQAADVETGPETRRPRDHILLDIPRIKGAADGGDDTPLPGNRLRLTPLGRHGLREYLLAEGIPAPLIGELADADAPTLLDALLDYDQESAQAEITGWISHRGQGPAAVQLIDVHLWGPPGVADEALAAFLDQQGDSVLPLLEQAADDLWRCDHPATRAVLEAAGRHLKAPDKVLAKRLRKSATRVGSQRRQ